MKAGLVERVYGEAPQQLRLEGVEEQQQRQMHHDAGSRKGTETETETRVDGGRREESSQVVVSVHHHRRHGGRIVLG